MYQHLQPSRRSHAASHDSTAPVSEQEALELRLERMLAKWRLATDQDQIKGPHTPFSSQWKLLDQVDTPESPQNSTGYGSTSLSSNHEDIDAIDFSHDEDPALYVAEDHLKSTSSSNATADLKGPIVSMQNSSRPKFHPVCLFTFLGCVTNSHRTLSPFQILQSCLRPSRIMSDRLKLP